MSLSPLPAESGSTPRHEDLLAEASKPALECIRKDMMSASPRVARMLGYIEKHLFDRSLNVDHLKKKCGIRDNSIAIVFHREAETPPKQYISQRRLETAARLLQSSNLKVWRIAKLVGFSGGGVFGRAFRRWAGHSPAQYRKLVQPLDMAEPSTGMVSPEFLDRAVAGQLSRQEAEWLMGRLRALYPDLQLEPGDSRKI